MLLSRFPRVVRFGVALFDYVLVLALAAVGALWGIAARLALDPDLTRIRPDFESWVVIATGIALVLYWGMTRRRAWFAERRGWRWFGAATVLALGVVGFVQVRTINLLRMDVSSFTDGSVFILPGGIFLLLVIGLFVLRRKALARDWLSTGSRVAPAVVLAAYLFYLNHDEAPAPSIARNHAAMSGRCEDDATYRLTLRYTPAPGGGKVFTPPARKLDFPSKGDKRTAYLRAHRTEIEANWAQLADVRAWWAEMAAQPQLGDRPGTDFDQPFIRFQPVRIYFQHALALAELHALDGDGDGALAAAGDVYAVGVRLGASSCTLVRGMIAVVAQRQAIETAAFVLDHAQVSHDSRARFATLLAEGKEKGGELGAKRLMLTDTVNFFGTAKGISMLKHPWFGRSDESWSMRIMGSVSGLLYFTTLNPQATSNRINDSYEKLAALAGARDLEGMKKSSDHLPEEQLGGFQVKNLSGRLLVTMAMPVFEKIEKSYWEVQDSGKALAKRLAESPPAT